MCPLKSSKGKGKEPICYQRENEAFSIMNELYVYGNDAQLWFILLFYPVVAARS